MIVLDTNVVSELMKAEPHEAVFSWTAGQARRDLYVASVTQAEILSGIAALPDGKRRHALDAMAEAIFSEDFAGRILPFDSRAAAHYAAITAARRRAGLPIEDFDALIAATALAANAAIATRDMAGFKGCGLDIINPWLAA